VFVAIAGAAADITHASTKKQRRQHARKTPSNEADVEPCRHRPRPNSMRTVEDEARLLAVP
jgi:hypothetical protein